MGEDLSTRVASFFSDLDGLPLKAEDVALIRKIVLHRLNGKGTETPVKTPSLNKLARDIFKISHERNEVLGDSCCPDPEWNMLLDLTVAHTEARPVYVSSLCIASGVPTTTALRHIERMEGAGLVTRHECETDKRRVWVEAQPWAIDAVDGLLRKCYEAGTP